MGECGRVKIPRVCTRDPARHWAGQGGRGQHGGERYEGSAVTATALPLRFTWGSYWPEQPREP